MTHPTPEGDSSHAVTLLNSLLRGEISAAETYKQAIDKIEDSSVATKLRQIQQEHGHAIDKLETHVRKLGGEPSTGSGVWGMWAKAIEGTATLLGTTTALQALQSGEEHGLNEYQDVLRSGRLPPDLESEIKNDLIPQQRKHIKRLEQMAG